MAWSRLSWSQQAKLFIWNNMNHDCSFFPGLLQKISINILLPFNILVDDLPREWKFPKLLLLHHTLVTIVISFKLITICSHYYCSDRILEGMIAVTPYHLISTLGVNFVVRKHSYKKIYVCLNWCHYMVTIHTHIYLIVLLQIFKKNVYSYGKANDMN